MNNKYLNQYKQTAVTTASKEQILLMLYEACIRNLTKAMDAIEQKDLKSKGVHIGKAHDIIMELSNSLNHEVGGEISRNLESLYTHMIDQLIKANIENIKEPLAAVKKNVETLYEGWKGAVEQLKTSQTSPR